MWDAQGRLPGPDLLCRLVKYLQVLGMFASSYVMVAMTVDRYYAICCPLQAHRGAAGRRRCSVILLAWSLSLLLSVPQVGHLMMWLMTLQEVTGVRVKMFRLFLHRFSSSPARKWLQVFMSAGGTLPSPGVSKPT